MMSDSFAHALRRLRVCLYGVSKKCSMNAERDHLSLSQNSAPFDLWANVVELMPSRNKCSNQLKFNFPSCVDDTALRAIISPWISSLKLVFWQFSNGHLQFWQEWLILHATDHKVLFFVRTFTVSFLLYVFDSQSVYCQNFHSPSLIDVKWRHADVSNRKYQCPNKF